MKHIKKFHSTKEYEDFITGTSEVVTSITCSDGYTYEYDGEHVISDDVVINFIGYYWYNSDIDKEVITFVRNPGIGAYNPATGTGANDNGDGIEIVSRTTEQTNTEHMEGTITSITELTILNTIDTNNYTHQFEYIGEYDVYEYINEDPDK